MKVNIDQILILDMHSGRLIKIPGWTSEAALDRNSRDYHTDGKSVSVSGNCEIIPHLRRIGIGRGNIDPFCYAGCREAGLGDWSCGFWCEEREIIRATL
jgi:hypothetical protein